MLFHKLMLYQLFGESFVFFCGQNGIIEYLLVIYSDIVNVFLVSDRL